MPRPSRVDAPYWARYLTVDKHGRWYWFEREPIAIRDDGSQLVSYWLPSEGHYMQAETDEKTAVRPEYTPSA